MLVELELIDLEALEVKVLQQLSAYLVQLHPKVAAVVAVGMELEDLLHVVLAVALEWVARLVQSQVLVVNLMGVMMEVVVQEIIQLQAVELLLMEETLQEVQVELDQLQVLLVVV